MVKKVLFWGAISLVLCVAVGCLKWNIDNRDAERELDAVVLGLEERGINLDPIVFLESIPKPREAVTNAAQVYLSIGEELKKGKLLFQTNDDLSSWRQGFWEKDKSPFTSNYNPDDLVILEQVFGAKEMMSTMQSLEATGEDCYFERDYSLGSSLMLPELHTSRLCVDWFLLRARLRAEQSKGTINDVSLKYAQSAYDDLITAIRIARHSRYDPTFIMQLTRISNMHRITECLQLVQRQIPCPAPTAKMIISLYEPDDDTLGYTLGVDGDMLMMTNDVFNKLAAPESFEAAAEMYREIKYLTEPTAELTLIEIIHYGTVIQLSRPVFLRNHAYVLECYSDARQLGSSGDAAALRIESELEGDVGRSRQLAKLLFSHCIKSRLVFYESRVRSELTRIGVLLDLFYGKYGYYPSSLELLASEFDTSIGVDPFSPSGESLIYKVENHGFLLYSLGKNGIDDNASLGGIYDEPLDVVFAGRGSMRF